MKRNKPLLALGRPRGLYAVHPVNRIIVTTDLSDASYAALPAARRFHSILEASKVRLTLLAVLENLTYSSTQFEVLSNLFSPVVAEAVHQKALAKLNDLARAYFPGLAVDIELRTAKRSVADEIAQYAQETQAGMIVMASHGRTGLSRALVGSVTERVLAAAPCPVLVVPSTPRTQRPANLAMHIVVATDLSPDSETALQYGRRIFDAVGHSRAQLTLLHIAEDITRATFHFSLLEDPESVRRDMEQRAAARLDELRTHYFPGLPVISTVMRATGPAEEELELYVRTHNVDLVIVASHGRSAAGRAFLGSAARTLLRASVADLLVLPPVKASA